MLKVLSNPTKQGITKALQSGNVIQIKKLITTHKSAVLKEKLDIGEGVITKVSVLSYAVIYSHDEVVDILLEAGAGIILKL